MGVLEDHFVKYIVKLFQEITIKSPIVRKQFIRQLRKNIRRACRDIDPDLVVEGVWDMLKIETRFSEVAKLRKLVSQLRRIPGIAHILTVHEYPFINFEDILAQSVRIYADQLAGKTFSVRVKRTGKHDFTSMDAERFCGCRN